MPRGTKDGSIFREEAKRDPVTGQVTRAERFIVRRRYTDSKGRPREKTRYAATLKAAERMLATLKKEIRNELAGQDQPSRRHGHTFQSLVDYCKAHQLKPALYVGEVKVAGLRSWRKTWSALRPAEKYFGQMLISTIDPDDLESYKELRLREPVIEVNEEQILIEGQLKTVRVRTSRPRSVASVDRELAWVRRVFSIAVSKKWVAEHPFKQDDPLINTSLENKRSRIISLSEERKLLAACTGKRKRLAFAITFALETAMRLSEQFRLTRADVDLDGRVLTALSYKGKRACRRVVPITDQLLPSLMTHLASHKSEKVFQARDARTAFENARQAVGLHDVTWHDLRHTAITRMVHVYNIPPHDVMKISGHTNWKTFWETYVNIDNEMVRAIGARIDAARAELPAVVAEAIEQVSDAIN